MEKNSIIFGPIPSRRFGLSLGVDLSPSKKQCNFDCLYCELKGSSTVAVQTNSLAIKEIIDELKSALKKHKTLDVITFTANGEPTLYPYLNELVTRIDKIKGDIKTLILSNGANIYKKDIQEILSKIDIVKLSLDCVSQKCFKKLDRVDSSVNCNKIIDGMIKFSHKYSNHLVIEILFVKNLNDNEEELSLLYESLKKINPSRVDIGTIDRPPAYDVQPVSYDFLTKVANRFENLPVVITHKNIIKNLQYFTEEEILNLLSRRPLTKNDIEHIFDNKSKTNLETLLQGKTIDIKNNNGVDFYSIRR